MGKLIKYLKPYTWLIVLIFALLFGQAMSDLSLPGFMSNIVNVGVQQGGIENATPKAVRASEFDKVTLFMTITEKAQVTGDYLRLDRGSLSPDQYNKYAKTYPELASAPIYVLNTRDKAQLTKLDSIFSEYIPAVAAIEQGNLSAAGTGLPSFPPGVDPFTVLAQLPSDQLSAVRSAIVSRTSAIPATELKQYSTVYISAEYKALGMNVSSIQVGYMIKIGLLMILLTLASAGRVSGCGLPFSTHCCRAGT